MKYERDGDDHIKRKDRLTGNAAVAAAERELENIFTGRPDGWEINSLQWIEANKISGTANFKIIKIALLIKNFLQVGFWSQGSGSSREAGQAHDGHDQSSTSGPFDGNVIQITPESRLTYFKETLIICPNMEEQGNKIPARNSLH